MSGVWSSFVTSAMSCSRPTNDVEVTGSEREARSVLDDRDAEGRLVRLALANRSLSSRARSSRTSRPSSRVHSETTGTTRVPSDWSSSIIAVSRGSRSGAGVLT